MKDAISLYWFRVIYNTSKGITDVVEEHGVESIFSNVYKFLVSDYAKQKVVKICDYEYIDTYNNGDIESTIIPKEINDTAIKMLNDYKSELKDKSFNSSNKEKADKIIRELELAIKNTSEEQLTW